MYPSEFKNLHEMSQVTGAVRGLCQQVFHVLKQHPERQETTDVIDCGLESGSGFVGAALYVLPILLAVDVQSADRIALETGGSQNAFLVRLALAGSGHQSFSRCRAHGCP